MPLPAAIRRRYGYVVEPDNCLLLLPVRLTTENKQLKASPPRDHKGGPTVLRTTSLRIVTGQWLGRPEAFGR